MKRRCVRIGRLLRYDDRNAGEQALGTSGKYRAFISYSHRDKQWGEWLHRKLEGYRTPKKIIGRHTEYGPIPGRLTPIFRDRDELPTSHDLGAEIQTALENSLFMLVVCSPASAQSRWVNEEIRTFKRLHGEGRVRAVIVDGVPGSDHPLTESFPEALKFRVDENGDITDLRAEPIAADLRKGGDGKKYAVSKIVAGLTGARLDDLIQREQARRNARMRLAAGGMTALALAFAGIAFEAMKQRDAARAAQTEAEAARDGAEGLIEFMLTDLRQRLEAVGRLDVLDTTGKRALAYYEASDLAAAPADQLGRRARAQLLVGEVDNLRGDLDAALEAYTAAAETTEEQLRRDPNNPDRIFDHSQSVFWVGYIAWQRGDAETARAHFTQYHDQAKRLVEIDPANEDYQAELEYSYSNLGTLAMDSGDGAEAEQWFRKSLAVSKSLHEKDPENVERALSAGQSYAWLEDALTLQIKLDDSLEHRGLELELYDNALRSNTNNQRILKRKLVAHDAIRELQIMQNSLGAAQQHAETAVVLAEILLGIESESTNVIENAALAYRGLGETQLYRAELGAAYGNLSKALMLGKQLVKADPAVAWWRREFIAFPEMLQARISAAQGDLEKARTHSNAALSQFTAINRTKNADTRNTERYAASLMTAIDLGFAETQRTADVIAMLEDTESDGGPDGLHTLAVAYNHAGADEKFRAISKRLEDAGYRHPEFLALSNSETLTGESPETAL